MADTLNSTPRTDGFWFPAEFERHYQTWLIWPERTDIYPYGAKLVQQSYVELATLISKYEKVTMCVSREQYQNARAKLPKNIRVIEMSSDGGWVRDTGPSFVINGKGNIRGVNWKFNSWGNTGYNPWNLDSLVAEKILEIENIERYSCNLTIEGGAFHCDGAGTLIATEESIINKNRNPDLTKENIEGILKDYLNVEKIIWIKRGLYLDESGGHIDGLCCFLKPGVVALNWTDDRSDPQYERSLEAYEILKSAKNSSGESLEIHKFHQPDPCYITYDEARWIDSVEGTVPRCEGDRLPSTYINFYFINGAVVLPTFQSKYDDLVIRQLKSIYPDKDIIPISSRNILLGGGNIHCMTQQQPYRNEN